MAEITADSIGAGSGQTALFLPRRAAAVVVVVVVVVVCAVDGVFFCTIIVHLPGGESQGGWMETGEESTEGGAVESGSFYRESGDRSPKDLELNE